MRQGKGVLFLVYLILGLYMINVAFNFVNLPEFISKIDKWIIFVGGILLILGGINYLKLKRHNL